MNDQTSLEQKNTQADNALEALLATCTKENTTLDDEDRKWFVVV